MLTSGISAEYGRFRGGVVNVVTKSGGNTFSGSYPPQLLSNPSWTDETPFETAAERARPTTRTDLRGHVRRADPPRPAVVLQRRPLTRTRPTPATLRRRPASGYDSGHSTTSATSSRSPARRRAEPHGAGRATPTTAPCRRTGAGLPAPIEPRTLVDAPDCPNDAVRGQLRTACCRRSCSRRRRSRRSSYGFRNTGGTSTDILDSPFRTRGLDGIPANQHYNAPYFDSTDPEDRNNRQVAGSLSTLLSSAQGAAATTSRAASSASRSTNTGGNSQTATGYVF